MASIVFATIMSDRPPKEARDAQETDDHDRSSSAGGGSAVAQQTPPDGQGAADAEDGANADRPAALPRTSSSTQAADQWLASKFKGTDVIGSNNEKIGDVNDILFDHNGKVMAYVVGVGGFLGIGAKDVALAPAAFQMQPATDREDMKLRLAMTRDEFKNAPEFKAASTRPAPTTGQAPPHAPPARRRGTPAALSSVAFSTGAR